MKPRNRQVDSFRLHTPLRASDTEPSYLATEAGSGKRLRWVLKYLPVGASAVRRDLREDFAELLSLDTRRSASDRPPG